MKGGGGVAQLELKLGENYKKIGTYELARMIRFIGLVRTSDAVLEKERRWSITTLLDRDWDKQ